MQRVTFKALNRCRTICEQLIKSVGVDLFEEFYNMEPLAAPLVIKHAPCLANDWHMLTLTHTHTHKQSFPGPVAAAHLWSGPL